MKACLTIVLKISLFKLAFKSDNGAWALCIRGVVSRYIPNGEAPVNFASRDSNQIARHQFSDLTVELVQGAPLMVKHLLLGACADALSSRARQ